MKNHEISIFSISHQIISNCSRKFCKNSIFDKVNKKYNMLLKEKIFLKINNEVIKKWNKPQSARGTTSFIEFFNKFF